MLLRPSGGMESQHRIEKKRDLFYFSNQYWKDSLKSDSFCLLSHMELHRHNQPKGTYYSSVKDKQRKETKKTRKKK